MKVLKGYVSLQDIYHKGRGVMTFALLITCSRHIGTYSTPQVNAIYSCVEISRHHQQSDGVFQKTLISSIHSCTKDDS